MLIYSMEPPFYSALNAVCRKDLSDITDEDYEFFGPFAYSLCTAINSERDRYDKIPEGISKLDLSLTPKLEDHDKLGFFNCSFILFRGLNLTNDDLKNWEAQIGKELFNGYPMPVCIRGFSSTSENYEIAHNFAIKGMEKGKYPVILVFCVLNYKGYTGFRLNTANYSEHCYEKEVLLQEGFRVHVLGSQVTDYVMKREKHLNPLDPNSPKVVVHTEKLRLLYLLNLEEAMI